MADLTYHDHPLDNSPAASDEIPYWDVTDNSAKRALRSAMIGAVLTGGGNIITGGFTLTVPASGVAALRDVAQTFSALQTFGAGINLGAENLTVYDEGTWTPAILGSTGNPTVTYSSQIGRYTRIGNRVFFDVDVTISTISGGSGNVQITLPFVVSGGNAIFAVWTNNLTYQAGVSHYLARGDTAAATMLVLGNRSGGYGLGLTVASLAPTVGILVTGHYMTN